MAGGFGVSRSALVLGWKVDQLVNLNVKEELFAIFDAENPTGTGFHGVEVAEVIPDAGVKEQPFTIGE